MSKIWNIQAPATSRTIRNKNDYPIIYIKLNIELVLCFLTQIDYHRAVAHEAEGPSQTEHKGATQTHDRVTGMGAQVNT